MYTQNFIAMEKEKQLQGCSEIIPGLIKKKLPQYGNFLYN